jgi:tetratricopeptide (TPR) repeat protein
MRRLMLVGAGILGIVCTLAAQPKPPSPQLNKEWLESPYQLTVQLHVQEHPLMTPAFVKGLERELGDTLQGDLNKICNVVVTTQKSQTMEDIVSKGWSVLDALNRIDDKKTHYVRVLYHEGGEYEIQSRQVDGYTGTVTPLRKARTTDRLWVSRQAALMVTQDFGMAGLVNVADSVDKVVRVRLKGANLAQPDSIRLQAGEVMGLIKVMKQGDKVSAAPVEGALLYVTSVQGGDNVATQLFSRFPVDIKKKERGKDPEYRVVKLGTRWAPLQLRVVDRETRLPISGVGVSICPGGDFEKGGTPIGATDAQGRVRSKEIYRNLAFVRLTQPGRNPVNLPLPLLDDQFADCMLAGNALAQRNQEFLFVLRGWQRRRTEAFTTLNGGTQELNKLLRKDKEREALDEAKKLLAQVDEDITALRNELDSITNKQAAEVGEQAVAAAKGESIYIDQLNAGKEKLVELIQDLETPSPASRKIREAREFEEKGDAAQAIEAYDAALKLDPSRKKIETYVAGLKKVWNIKAPDLDKARKFIFEAWPALDPNELDEHEKELDDAVKALEKHSDNLSALKLFKVNLEHREKLSTARSSLNDNNADDQEKAVRIDKIIDIIGKYNRRILELMEKGAK